MYVIRTHERERKERDNSLRACEEKSLSYPSIFPTISSNQDSQARHLMWPTYINIDNHTLQNSWNKPTFVSIYSTNTYMYMHVTCMHMHTYMCSLPCWKFQMCHLVISIHHIWQCWAATEFLQSFPHINKSRAYHYPMLACDNRYTWNLLPFENWAANSLSQQQLWHTVQLSQILVQSTASWYLNENAYHHLQPKTCITFGINIHVHVYSCYCNNIYQWFAGVFVVRDQIVYKQLDLINSYSHCMK